MKIRPLHDRVIVKRIEEERRTASGIVIPDTAKEKPQEGKVLAVGPGRYEEGKLIPLDVKPGDTVIYSKYGGTEVKVGGKDMLILSERDILAKRKKPAGKSKK
jgi:chaperonin GroES